MENKENILMKLKLWLVKNRKTEIEFAQQIGYCRSYISQIACGTLRPSKRLAKAIEEATGGQVTASSLMRLKEPK